MVVIPTYNEIANLKATVQRVRAVAPKCDVLIVDDSSPDGTGSLADDLTDADPHVHVLHRPSKDGLGRAYIAGFRWALVHDYTVIVEMDADGSHQPEKLPTLLEALGHADAVVGARWVDGADVRDWSKSRVWLSRAGNRYIRMMLGINLTDATAGFRAYRDYVLRGIDLETVQSEGYCFQVDLSRRAVHAGFTLREVPITFVERTAGSSKMSKAIVTESLFWVTRWGVADRAAQLRTAIGRIASRAKNRRLPKTRSTKARSEHRS